MSTFVVVFCFWSINKYLMRFKSCVIKQLDQSYLRIDWHMLMTCCWNWDYMMWSKGFIIMFWYSCIRPKRTAISVYLWSFDFRWWFTTLQFEIKFVIPLVSIPCRRSTELVVLQRNESIQRHDECPMCWNARFEKF